MSVGLGDFDIPVGTQDDGDLDAFQALDQAGLVRAGELVRARLGEGFAEQVQAKNLGSLGEDEALARNRLTDLVQMDLFDGVHRNDADDGRTGFGGGIDHLVDGFQVDKGPDGVMHGDKVRIGGKCCERVLDRLLA